MTRPPRIAVTLGDPRGIGPEIATHALAESVGADVVVVGAAEQVAMISGAHPVEVGSWQEGSGQPAALSAAEARTRAARAGAIAGRSIERAVAMALAGEVDAIVTAPIEKHAVHLAGYPWPGHTEWLAHLAGDCPVAMMLAAGPLRVVLVTTHVALRDVPALLTSQKVITTGEVTRRGLQRWFGMAEPRLAVCALNPHAGEQGLFGDEEARILEPAARALGARGPLPADTVFVRALRGEFDAVLAPYHDVGMTAIKVAAFGEGVNITLGLPFPRTSPDHGTALDIAGRGVADPSSMVEAVRLAVRLAGANR